MYINNFSTRVFGVQLCHLSSRAELLIFCHRETDEILGLALIEFLIFCFNVHFHTQSGSDVEATFMVG